MLTSLRQRRSRWNNDESDGHKERNVNGHAYKNSENNAIIENGNLVEDEFLAKVAVTSQQSSSSSLLSCLLAFISLLGLATVIVVVSRRGSNDSIILEQGRGNHAVPSTRDLKLLSAYPYQVSSRVHIVEGQTELLITEENRDLVDAIQNGISMINNFSLIGGGGRKIRRKRNWGFKRIVLGVSNFIASLFGRFEDQPIDFVPGGIMLELYDLYKIRSYLLRFGEQCLLGEASGNADGTGTNKLLERFDELLHMVDEISDDASLDVIWNNAINLWMLCNFVNGDARGFVAHGTTMKKQSIEDRENNHSFSPSLADTLEEARVAGTGIAVQNSAARSRSFDQIVLNDSRSTYLSPLIILPAGEDGAVAPSARLMSRRILWSILGKSALSLSTMSFEASLLAGDENLPDLFLQEEGVLGEPDDSAAEGSTNRSIDKWLIFESSTCKISDCNMENFSEIEWLAKYCRDYFSLQTEDDGRKRNSNSTFCIILTKPTVAN